MTTDPAPLAGLRVADFTWVWAGPFCTLQLAHLGAEVIRVETATRICVTRLLPPYPRDVAPGPNRSGYFNQYNQGKQSITLDLKRPEAVAVARRLCAASIRFWIVLSAFELPLPPPPVIASKRPPDVLEPMPAPIRPAARRNASPR